ncbi:MFS transporter [Azospirillum griseum]|nr:MFS transporter [Azospirillum griseum]
MLRSDMLPVLLVVFIAQVGFGLVMPLLPFYSQRFGASPLAVVALFSAFSLTQMVTAPLWGRVSDRYGRKPVLCWSMMVSVGAYLWMSQADSLLALFLCRSVQGASSANMAVAQAYIADRTDPEERSKSMAAMGVVSGVSFALGPLLGGLLAELSDTPPGAHPFVAAGALCAVAFLVVALFAREPAVSRDQRQRRGVSLQQFPGLLAQPRLRVLTGLFFATTLIFSGVNATVALWAQEYFAWGPHEVGLLMTTVGTVMVAVQLLGVGRIVRRFGDAGALVAGVAVIICGLLAMAIPGCGSLGVVANSLLAIGFGLTQPTIAALVSREGREGEVGSLLGVNQSMGSLGRLLGPMLAGGLFTLGGSVLVYALGALVMIGPLWATVWFARRTPVLRRSG